MEFARWSLFLIVVFVNPGPSTPLQSPPPSSPTPKKSEPGLSSRISSKDQPETSFLPLIRNSGLLPTLPLASVSPWYVPQDNPLVSLPFPPTMGLSRCLQRIYNPQYGTFENQLTFFKVFGWKEERQRGGQGTLSPTREGGRGSPSSALRGAQEPCRLRGRAGALRAGETRWGGSRERVGVS